MNMLMALVKRNTKLFFKDKGTFLTALITPLILLVLFISFLGNVYRDSFQSIIPEGIEIEKGWIEGFVGGWLFSSLFATSCVTVAFCANMIMVQDKVTSSRADLTIAPVKSSILALSYYISSCFITLIICYTVFIIGLIYLAIVGWYLSIADVLLTILDIFLLVLFGTALSSIINSFLQTQGQIVAVSTVVSAFYGFICGAYMPISQFSKGIQSFVSFLPGTYGTGLLRNHLMGGVLDEMKNNHIPNQLIEALQDGFDQHIYCLGHSVSIASMYTIVIATVVVLIGIYVGLHVWFRKKK